MHENLYYEVTGNDPHHRVLGHPFIIQNDDIFLDCQLASNDVYAGNPESLATARARELAPGAEGWQLLLQVSSDDNAGMMWGDGGMVYFCIRRQDLVTGEFDGCWAVVQDA